MKKHIFILFIGFIVVSCSKNNQEVATNSVQNTPSETFIRGADVSFLPLIESEGTIYKKNGIAENALITLKNAGCNTVRIRLWCNPIYLHSGLAEVKALCIRAQQLGLKIWLAVHYSDTWADPANQIKPVAWQNLSFQDLKTASINYTNLILSQIQPDIFQVGNETNDGMLWPEGNLTSNQNQYLQLLQGITSTIRSQSPNTKIMIHYAGIGFDAVTYFNKLSVINYDYIGLSYYPIWHGKILSDVTSTINSLSQTFNKKVVIAETSYPFTLTWNDYTNNVIGLNNQLIPTFAATPEGQKNFLLAIKSLVKQTSNGIGFCYWGGEWIAFRGPLSTNGSSWENQSLWDFSNNALPVLDAFGAN